MDRKRTKIGLEDLKKWLRKEGFTRIEFAQEKESITTYWLEQAVVFKLMQREGFETFYKEAKGGSLLVFEIGMQGDKIIYEGYCPILLFGFWSMKMKFKKKSLLPYPKQGYQVREKLKRYLE